jgi:hypothetical protein
MAPRWAIGKQEHRTAKARRVCELGLLQVRGFAFEQISSHAIESRLKRE